MTGSSATNSNGPGVGKITFTYTVSGDTPTPPTPSSGTSYTLVKDIDDFEVDANYLIGTIDGAAYMSSQTNNNRSTTAPTSSPVNGTVVATFSLGL
jgi:hypothetical protein